MKKLSEPILFFGSGPVAAKSLDALCDNFYVAGVITKPVPPHHHEQAPVERLAKDKSIKTYYARDKNELKVLFSNDVDIENIRMGVLIDFGIIVPGEVLDYFKIGIINSHFSLLPQLRGADPITFAILSGQKKTGVSLMVIVPGMDEGPIIAQESYALPPTITTPELTNELIEISNGMLASSLPAYATGKLRATPQDPDSTPTYSRKLYKDDGYLDWKKSAGELEREIRAFVGWPGSYTTMNGIKTIVTRGHVEDIAGQAGVIEIINRQLVVHCNKQALVIDRLKPAGKKEMSSADFLRGYSI
jgi:methionyl-tRNA formyltransferase